MWKKDKDGKFQGPWMKRDVANLVKKEKDVYIRFMKLKLNRVLEKYEVSRKEIK